MFGKEESRWQDHFMEFKAGWLKNNGKRNTQETSLAKWISCDAAYEAANDAVQVHGAYGFSNEFPVERYLRNAKAPVIYEGTREIHTIMQAEYALGYREDKPLRKMLSAWPFEEKKYFKTCLPLCYDNV